jgi:hypothetical protein
MRKICSDNRGHFSRAVALDMLVEPDTGTGLGHDRCERGLADLRGVTAQVVAIQFDEVEGVQQPSCWRYPLSALPGSSNRKQRKLADAGRQWHR